MKPRYRLRATPALQYGRAQPADIPAMSRIRLAVTENMLSDPGKVTLQMYHDYLQQLGRGWVCRSGRGGDNVVSSFIGDRKSYVD